MTNWPLLGFQQQFKFKPVLTTVLTRKRHFEPLGGQALISGLSAAVKIQAFPVDGSFQKAPF